MKHLTSFLLLGCCCAFAGCNRTEDPERVSLTAQTALDSGNVTYRRGDYEAANKYFRQAARAEPNNVAGWYGVYMAESKLGNKAAADSARTVVAKMAPDLPTGEHPTMKTMAPPNPHAQKEKPNAHP